MSETYQSTDGRIWIGTAGGLTAFSEGRFQSYTEAQGLTNGWVVPVEDRDGNLWLATQTGAMKITWSGFTSFGKGDGLSNTRVTSVFENQRGELCVTTAEAEPVINCFDGQRFTTVRPQLPPEIKSSGWGWNQITFQDHTGEWWLPTEYGIYRFPRVMNSKQLAPTLPRVYNQQHGDLRILKQTDCRPSVRRVHIVKMPPAMSGWVFMTAASPVITMVVLDCSQSPMESRVGSSGRYILTMLGGCGLRLIRE